MLMHAISSPRAQSLTASPAHPGPGEAAASSQGLNISKDRIRQTPRTCTDKYNKGTEGFLCHCSSKDMSVTAQTCSSGNVVKTTQGVQEPSFKGRVCLTPGVCNPASAQPQGEHGATRQPHRHGCPQAAGKDILPFLSSKKRQLEVTLFSVLPRAI